MEIANRQILITGASRGIGRAFAKMCAEEKAHLHLVMRVSDSSLVAELDKLGARSVTIWENDLGQRQGVEDLIQGLADAPIDILFNNAGLLTGGLLEQQSLEDIYNLMQVNVTALIHLTRGILPGMLKRKRGKIINHSSIAAYIHFPCASTYAASKAAVSAFTECLRLELKGTGVSTLLLVTPSVKTHMTDQIENLYSKHFKIPKKALQPAQYVKMIREAILHDLDILEPGGITGLGLKISRYAKPILDYELLRRFTRD
jgi:short-subunit dehydrogenase